MCVEAVIFKVPWLLNQEKLKPSKEVPGKSQGISDSEMRGESDFAIQVIILTYSGLFFVKFSQSALWKSQ